MNASTKVELLKLAAQLAAQEKNWLSLAERLSIDAAADVLTVTLAIAQELFKAVATDDTPAKP